MLNQKQFNKQNLLEKLIKLDADDNATDAGDNDQSMFVLTISNNFRKNQRNKTKIFSRMCNSIIKDAKLSRSKS